MKIEEIKKDVLDLDECIEKAFSHFLTDWFFAWLNDPLRHRLPLLDGVERYWAKVRDMDKPEKKETKEEIMRYVKKYVTVKLMRDLTKTLSNELD